MQSHQDLSLKLISVEGTRLTRAEIHTFRTQFRRSNEEDAVGITLSGEFRLALCIASKCAGYRQTLRAQLPRDLTCHRLEVRVIWYNRNERPTVGWRVDHHR
jgi:hypothetical protein